MQWKYSFISWKVKVLVAHSCLILCDPVDCSLPCSSVRGILKARILEWVAIPFSRGSSWPRDLNCLNFRENIFNHFLADSEAPCPAGRLYLHPHGNIPCRSQSPLVLELNDGTEWIPCGYAHFPSFSRLIMWFKKSSNWAPVVFFGFSYVVLNLASFPVNPFNLMFPSPACLATVAICGELALPSIWSTTAGFRRLLFLSSWVDLAFASFKDDHRFSKLQALEFQVSAEVVGLESIYL